MDKCIKVTKQSKVDMQRKTLIATFDYELFFGKKWGTVELSIFRTTRNLLPILKSTGATVVFFVDAGMLLYYFKESPSIHNKLCDHLLLLRDQGHRIDFHLHPNWYARLNGLGRNGKEPVFYHEFVEEYSDQDLKRYFKQAYNHLFNVLKPSSNMSPIIAFRAAAWSYTPQHLVSEILTNLNIPIDSSVCPGISLDWAKMDFTNSPTSSAWSYSGGPESKDDNGPLIEAPIASTTIPRRLRLKDYLSRANNLKRWENSADGQGYATSNSKFLSKLSMVKSLILNHPIALDSDRMLPETFEYLASKWCKIANTSFAVSVGHNKFLSNNTIDLISYMSQKDWIIRHDNWKLVHEAFSKEEKA